VDLTEGVIVIESLKKRRLGIFRAVPVPPVFLETLDAVHGLKAWHRQRDRGANVPLWDISRSTGWRRIREIMAAAEIEGVHATPKGLRHGFGVKAVTAKIPLNMTQRWLGHANLATTAIYAQAVGLEEKQIAATMWDAPV
jgi:integrase